MSYHEKGKKAIAICRGRKIHKDKKRAREKKMRT
jgi:hypothetical protein